jgi:hypothetical protein
VAAPAAPAASAAQLSAAELRTAALTAARTSFFMMSSFWAEVAVRALRFGRFGDVNSQ